MKKIFIIAGEASGDLLGAALMRDLKKLHPDVIFSGIGGEQMTAQGLTSLFPMTDLSIMGVVEVIKHLPTILKRLRQTSDEIKKKNPDILVTIDSPDFCLRIAKKIKKNLPHIKCVHMVAPTVWAWRPGRAEKIARFLDGLMCLFPFEPTYFTPHGLKAVFIGHPLTSIIQPVTEDQKNIFYQKYSLDKNPPILCLLPGSRMREIDSLWPIFLETAKRLKKDNPALQILVPTLPHLQPYLNKPNITFITDLADKYLAMQVSTVALHASGTVALELALCGTPMITAYKVSPMTAWLAKKLLLTRFANLVNILLDRAVVPEMLQEEVVPEKLVPLLQEILSNPLEQTNALEKIRPILTPQTPDIAARFVTEFLH